jgi:hypothetical protein
MRLGIIGGGTIARLLLQHIRAGDLGAVEVTLSSVVQMPRAASALPPNSTPFVKTCVLFARRPEVHRGGFTRRFVRRPPVLNVGAAPSCPGWPGRRHTLQRPRAPQRSTGRCSTSPGGDGGLALKAVFCIAGATSHDLRYQPAASEGNSSYGSSCTT